MSFENSFYYCFLNLWIETISVDAIVLFIRRNLFILALLQVILEKLACLLANQELILAYLASLLEDPQLIRKFPGLLAHYNFY